MQRILVFVYGTVNYVMFLGVFLYMVGFLGNFGVPTRVDGELQGAFGVAVGINLLLVLLFGVQHTVMARPTFKRWLTKFIPQPAERATYMMLTNIALILLYWQWRPTGTVLWDVQSDAGRAVLYGLFALGWLIVLITTFLINHFELFGLQQVWQHVNGKEFQPPKFVMPGPYKIVRHPLYVGWLTAFWFTPRMTVGHLIFALGMTIYILIAIYYEERNLLEFHRESYAEYRSRVPMLIPIPRRSN